MEITAPIAIYTPYLLTGSGLIAAIAAAWVVRLPKLAIVALGVSIVAGQLIRFPLPGQGGGVLISDVATVILIAAAALKALKTKKIVAPARQLLLRTSPFILWSLLSLAANTPQLALTEVGIGFAYWIRLTTYILIPVALVILLQDSRIRAWTIRIAIISVGVLIILGFLQVMLKPDLTSLAAQGWDPHQGRMVSTWLDPNFFGGIIAMTIPLVLTQIKRRPTTALIMLVITIAALVATQSRTSFLSIGLAGLITTPIALIQVRRRVSVKRQVQIVSGVALVIVLVGCAGYLLGDRLLGVLQIDPTVNLRVESLKAAWPLAEENSVIGIGYNTYQFAAEKAGLISGFNIHSRAGTDSSYLTLWITTGIIGLILFLWPYVFVLKKFIATWLERTSPIHITAATSILVLLIHANGINSLLYAHLLLVVGVIIALAVTSKEYA